MDFYTAESFMAEAAKTLADRGQSYDSPEGERSMAKTVEGFMREAEKIMIERGEIYDSPTGERSMEKTVALFNLRTGHTLTEAEGWTFMGYLKDVRQDASGGAHADSAVDRVNYALLEAEARFRKRMNT